jgi:hypothetical protein
MNTEPTNSDAIEIVYFAESFVDLTYNYRNDTLFLSDKSYAVKIDTSHCNMHEEFFGELYVSIELPYSGKTISKSEFERQIIRFSYINIGKPKRHIKQFHRDTLLIQVNDIFASDKDIREYIEREQSTLPLSDRDSLILAFSIHKQAPAHLVDSIEQIINWYYPNLRIIYACLPGEKQYETESVFASLKNDFTKLVDQSDAVVLFDVNETG